MRLRPSLGQLRLQREAMEVCNLPWVHMSIEPEQLRASLMLDVGSSWTESGMGSGMSSGMGSGMGSGMTLRVQLEVMFPPQYPHRSPRIVQISPEQHLPSW